MVLFYIKLHFTIPLLCVMAGYHHEYMPSHYICGIQLNMHYIYLAQKEDFCPSDTIRCMIIFDCQCKLLTDVCHDVKVSQVYNLWTMKHSIIKKLTFKMEPDWTSQWMAFGAVDMKNVIQMSGCLIHLHLPIVAPAYSFVIESMNLWRSKRMKQESGELNTALLPH